MADLATAKGDLLAHLLPLVKEVVLVLKEHQAGIVHLMAVKVPLLDDIEAVLFGAAPDAVGGVIATLVNASAALIIGQLGDRLSLTPVLTWSVTGACLLLLLIWSAYYYTYRKDNTRMQEILKGRHSDISSQ